MSEKFFKILRSNCHGCYLSNTCENFHFVGNVFLNQANLKSIPIFTLFLFNIEKKEGEAPHLACNPNILLT